MSQGRKIPKSTWKKFLKALAETASSITGASNQVGITPRSYYNHRYEDPTFGMEVDRILDAIRRPFAEDVIFALMADKNLGAAKFFLSRMGGSRWRPEPARHGPELERDRLKRERSGVFASKRPSKAALAAKRAYADALREGE